MTYIKTTWVNGTTPAINATNLNNIENGIAALDTEINTPDFQPFEINETNLINSVTDSEDGAVKDLYVGGASLNNQLIIAVDSSFTPVGDGTKLQVNSIGTITRSDIYNASNITIDAVSGNKYFIYFETRDAVLYADAVGLLYSDGTNTTGSLTTNGDNKSFGIITATKTLKANPFNLENSATITTPTLFKKAFCIPITDTPYELWDVTEIAPIIGEYWEGLKSVEQINVGSRGKNVFDKNDVILGFSYSSTGILVAGVGAGYTKDLIRIKKGSTYRSTEPVDLVLYDEKNSFISRIAIAKNTNTVLNAPYIRVSAGTLESRMDSLLLEEVQAQTLGVYEVFDGSKLTIDVSGQPIHLLPNLVENSMTFNDGRFAYSKNADKTTVLSGTLINTTNVSGAKLNGSYMLYQTDGVTSIGLVDGTYTTTADATIIFELATPITIDQEDFADNGIDIDGVLTSNIDYTEWYADGFNLLPSRISFDYPANLSGSISTIKNELEQQALQSDIIELALEETNLVIDDIISGTQIVGNADLLDNVELSAIVQKSEVNIVQSGTMTITTGSWTSASGLVYKNFAVSGVTLSTNDKIDVTPTITTSTVAEYAATMQVQSITYIDSTTLRVYALADPGGSVACAVDVIRDGGI